MVKINNILTCLLLLELAIPAAGQRAELYLESDYVKFRNLAGVSHILQDRFGFLWFGTPNGLAKFDGYSATLYQHDPADSASLSENSITALAEAPAGMLWIGTIRGLNQFNPATGKCVRYWPDPNNPGSLSDYYITSLLIDHSGKLWLGTREGGLNAAIPEKSGYKFIHFRHDADTPASLSHDHVQVIREDTLNIGRRLWIGTACGLNSFEPETGTWTRYFHDPKNPHSLPGDDLHSIFQDASGDLWFGAKGGWLSRLAFPAGRELVFEHFRIDPRMSVCGITGDENDNLWLSVGYHGLFRFNKKSRQFKYFTAENLNLKNIVRFSASTTFFDHSGTMWIGTWPFLYKLDPHRRKFEFIDLEPPPKKWAMNVTAFWQSDSTTLWLGTFGRGVLKYDLTTGQITPFASDSAAPHRISSPWVSAIQSDRLGRIWVATYYGLNRFDPAPGRFTQVIWDPDLPDAVQPIISNYIYSLGEDRQGNLWVGSSRGLSRLNPVTGQTTHFLNDAENQINLAGHYIGAIHEDRQGTLWIGAKGLFQFDPVRGKLLPFFCTENDIRQPISDLVFEIYEDCRGDLWVGTIGGLYRIDRTRQVTRFTTRNGLPNNLIPGIVEDSSHSLWISTLKGLARFEPESSQFRFFDIKVGWHRNELLGAFCDQDGRIYLAQANGFSTFQPEAIRDNPIPPRVWITGLTVFDQPVIFARPLAELKEIRLTQAQNMFTFSFVGLSFTESEDNRYAYKLEGFNTDWVQCGNRRSATFTNPGPGKYIFRVKACNNDGIWNETGAAIRLIITPPWFRSRWAILVYLVFVLAGFIGSARLIVMRQRRLSAARLLAEQEKHRIETAEQRAEMAELQARATEAEKEIEKEQMRSRIASDLHDEIGSNLSTIAIISQLAADRLKLRPAEKQRLREIPRIARETAESMRDIIWFIHPENDSMEQLLVKMRQTANLMLEAIDFDFNAPEAGLAFTADINFRRNVYLIFKEILQNIIKHARATQVEIVLSEQNGFFELQVTDNGIGIDTTRGESGTGMKIFQRRAQTLGGVIEIHSEKNQGTRILFRVKIP